MNISRMGRKDLEDMLAVSSDDALIEEIYDELERRERDEELRDWDEQDRRAAQEERLEMWRNEF